MAGQIFSRIYKVDAKEFETVPEVDHFVEGKIGRKLGAKYVHQDVCSSRGSVLAIKETGDASTRFIAAMSK